MIQQIDLFGNPDPQTPARTKARNVDAEAKALLDKTGISALSKEEKAYIAARLINDMPELQPILKLAIAMKTTETP